VPSPPLNELTLRLVEISQRILLTPAENLPAIADWIRQREALLQQIAAEMKANPAAASDPALANLCSAEAAGRRIAEHLNLARASLCEQLQSLYRDNFRLRAWLAQTVNQPQECDCRG